MASSLLFSLAPARHWPLAAILWAGALLSLALTARAQTSAPKYSNEFLKIGVGARAAGMGNAMSAAADDATAGYWNPAGLAHLGRRHELSLMHSEYFAGIAKYDFAAYATRMDSGRYLAFSFVRMGIDDIPNTLNFRDGAAFNFARITQFSVADMALLVSYAQRIRGVRGLSVGGSFKIINRTIGPFATAWGFGVDAGAQLRRGRWLLGAHVADVTSTFNLWSFNTETFADAFIATGNEVPTNSMELALPSIRLSAAHRFWPGRTVSLLVAAEAELNTDGRRNVLFNAGGMSVDPRLGAEATYKDIVYLRAGLMNVQRIPTPDGSGTQLTAFPTAGLGLRLPLANYHLQLDYALSNIGDFRQILYSHLISLRFGFDRIVL